MNAEPANLAERIAAKVRADIPHTDTGNAERLIADHGEELRHATGIGWLAWDGRRWRIDAEGKEVARRLKATVRAMRDEAAQMPSGPESKALFNHANRSESATRIDAAMKQAKREASIDVADADFDAAPMLLNVENGTLDLATGELRGHDPADLLTKLAPVEFDPDADRSTWMRLLDYATGGDRELAAFLQRAAGYTLTGDTREEVLFFAHGPTQTGKTTFLEAFARVLGADYASTMPFASVLAMRGAGGGDRPRDDLWRVRGARFVKASETEEAQKLDAGLLKQLTGGDTITARTLNARAIEFTPQLKLWLAANDRPEVSGEDDAMWRRIVNVPFIGDENAEPDPAVKRQLTRDPEARAGILAWAVEGCAEWQKVGLAIPESVRAYTAEYRSESGDPFARWFEMCCELDPGSVTPAAALLDSFNRWAMEYAQRPLKARALGMKLRDTGLHNERKRDGVVWHGVTLGGAA